MRAFRQVSLLLKVSACFRGQTEMVIVEELCYLSEKTFLQNFFLLKIIQQRLFFDEINLREKKQLLSCSYHRNRENIKNHFETLSKNVALYSSSYENLIIIDEFNVCVEEISMSEFCDTFGLKSLIKDATCYRNPENTSSIDLILINNPHSFQNFCVIETNLLDFNKMVATVMKTSFERLKSRVKKYRL